jgi:hypothetical protein
MDIRQFIKDELTRQGISAYKLANAVKATLDDQGKPIASCETVYRYLRAERDTSGDVLGTILTYLGISLVRSKTKGSK